MSNTVMNFMFARNQICSYQHQLFQHLVKYEYLERIKIHYFL